MIIFFVYLHFYASTAMHSGVIKLWSQVCFHMTDSAVAQICKSPTLWRDCNPLWAH